MRYEEYRKYDPYSSPAVAEQIGESGPPPYEQYIRRLGYIAREYVSNKAIKDTSSRVADAQYLVSSASRTFTQLQNEDAVTLIEVRDGVQALIDAPLPQPIQTMAKEYHDTLATFITTITSFIDEKNRMMTNE